MRDKKSLSMSLLEHLFTDWQNKKFFGVVEVTILNGEFGGAKAIQSLPLFEVAAALYKETSDAELKEAIRNRFGGDAKFKKSAGITSA